MRGLLKEWGRDRSRRENLAANGRLSPQPAHFHICSSLPEEPSALAHEQRRLSRPSRQLCATLCAMPAAVRAYTKAVSRYTAEIKQTNLREKVFSESIAVHASNWAGIQLNQ